MIGWYPIRWSYQVSVFEDLIDGIVKVSKTDESCCSFHKEYNSFSFCKILFVITLKVVLWLYFMLTSKKCFNRFTSDSAKSKID